MSNPSKNIPAPINHIIRRWQEEIGSRSRRAPAFTGTADSLLPCQDRHAADRQGLNGQPAILVEGILLRRLEKFLAAPRGTWVEPENAIDESIGLERKPIGRTDLRDEADFERLLRADRIAEQDEGKREARQSVLAQVGHNGGWRETRTHLGKSQLRVLGDEDEVTHNRKTEAKPEGVALDLGDADQR